MSLGLRSVGSAANRVASRPSATSSCETASVGSRPPPAPDFAELIRRVRDRDQEAAQELVRRYEGRTLGLNIFLLARDWRKAGDAAKASPKLLQAGADLLDTAIRSGETRQLAQLGHAVELLSGLNPRRLRTAFGYADWWKLHALVYMLRHPREAYRTREVRAHLETLGLRITSLDFRRFCKRHDIRRDERAGRPRVRAAQAVR